MKLHCNEGIVLQKLLAVAFRLVCMWVRTTPSCGMNGAEWQLRGRSGEKQYAGLGRISGDQILHKGSAEENKSWFFTEAVGQCPLGILLPRLTSLCCVQSPDWDWWRFHKMLCAVLTLLLYEGRGELQRWLNSAVKLICSCCLASQRNNVNGRKFLESLKTRLRNKMRFKMEKYKLARFGGK